MVTVSSSFVEEAPAGFGAYVALKQAVEGLARTASREARGVFWLTARPPRLQTAWNDTPTGVLGTIPADRAASHIVHRLADAWLAEARQHASREGGWTPGALEVLSEFPEFEAAAVSDDVEPEFTVLLSATFTAEPVARRPAVLVQGTGYPRRRRGRAVRPGAADAARSRRGLHRSAGMNVVLLRVRDWLRELPQEQAASPEFVAQYLDATARDLERAMRAHRAQAAAETLLVALSVSAGSDSPAIDALRRATEHRS